MHTSILSKTKLIMLLTKSVYFIIVWLINFSVFLTEFRLQVKTTARSIKLMHTALKLAFFVALRHWHSLVYYPPATYMS